MTEPEFLNVSDMTTLKHIIMLSNELHHDEFADEIKQLIYKTYKKHLDAVELES